MKALLPPALTKPLAWLLGAVRRLAAGGRLLALVLLGGFLLLRAVDPSPVETLRLKTFDLFQQLKPYKAETRPVAIVDIDERSLEAVGQWPWPRHYLAAMIQNLTAAGAAAIGLDIVFAEPDGLSPANFAARANNLDPEIKKALEAMPGNDEVFAAFIERSRVVLGQAANENPVEKTKDRPPILTPVAEFNGDPRGFLFEYKGIVRNLEILEKAAAGRGMFSLAPERDGIVRRVPSVFVIDGDLYPTLGIEMLRVATGQKQYAIKRRPKGGGIKSVTVARNDIPTDINGRIWVRFARHDPALYIPAVDVLLGEFDKDEVRGKLILVGTSASGLRDLRPTPLEHAMPGVEVHAQLLETILNNAYLTRPDIAKPLELLVTLLAGLLLIVFVPMLGAAWTALIFLGVSGTLFGGSWYLFAENAYLIDAAYPVASGFILFVLLVFGNYIREEAQKRQVREAFGQYLSPALVEQLASNPDQLRLGGETKEMTFLFCDVRGFTTISEQYRDDPNGLTTLINRLLTPLSDAILSRDGTIDKYIGDCVMAFWNAPLDNFSHATLSCDAALAMFREMETLNAKLRQEAEESGTRYLPIKIGIGINTGICVVGNVGSEQRFDYSVLGDSVNLASRLEGQSKTYGVDTVIGPETAALAGDRFAMLELDLIAVKGKKEAVRISTLLGDSDMREAADFQALEKDHEAMLEAYRGRDWDRTEALIAACRGKLGGRMDGFYCHYSERISGFRETPPPEDWDGVFVATTK